MNGLIRRSYSRLSFDWETRTIKNISSCSKFNCQSDLVVQDNTNGPADINSNNNIVPPSGISYVSCLTSQMGYSYSQGLAQFKPISELQVTLRLSWFDRIQTSTSTLQHTTYLLANHPRNMSSTSLDQKLSILQGYSACDVCPPCLISNKILTVTSGLRRSPQNPKGTPGSTPEGWIFS